jgi:hypothetical protein
MSARQEYVRLCCKVNPNLVAMACRRIQRVMDYADDQKTITLLCDIAPAHNYTDSAHVWMAVALLLADTAEIDSVTLNSIANSLSKDTQDVLFG